MCVPIHIAGVLDRYRDWTGAKYVPVLIPAQRLDEQDWKGR